MKHKEVFTFNYCTSVSMLNHKANVCHKKNIESDSMLYLEGMKHVKGMSEIPTYHHLVDFKLLRRLSFTFKEESSSNADR